MKKEKKLIIEIGQGVKLINTPTIIRDKITKDLTFDNPAYKKAIERGGYTSLPPQIVLFDSEKTTFWLPRGYVFFLIRFLKKINHPYDIVDETKTFNPKNFKFYGKLRDYQEEAKNKILQYPIGVLEAGTGSGKTVSAISVIAERKQPTLILVHTKELLYQWKDRIKEFLHEDCGLIGDGKFEVKPITVGTIQTVKKRREEIMHSFGFLVVDECFVKGTLIDGKPIETLKVGDYVNSYNHKTNKIEKKKILHVFKNKLKGDLIQINTPTKKGPISTLNHPFFDPVKNKYLTASKFNDSNTMYSIAKQSLNLSKKGIKNEIKSTKQLQNMWKRNNSLQWRSKLFTNFSCTSRISKMFGRMLPKSKRNWKRKIRKKFVGIQQKICQRTNEKKQSFVQSKNYRKSKSYQKIKRYIAYLDRKTRWQWATNQTTRKIGSSIRLENRSSYSYSKSLTNRSKTILESTKKRPNLLQSRHRKFQTKTCNRSGFKNAPNQTTPKLRQEEGIFLEMERVESVEIYQRGNRQQFKTVSGNNFVYNIEVEDNNNYFAEGILVHNCHRYATQGTAFTIQDFSAKYYLGLTATPFRSDGLGRIIFAIIGPKIHIVNQKNLLDTKMILRPDIYTIETDFYYMFTDDYSRMITDLVQDKERNMLICEEIASDLRKNNDTLLVVSDRKQHIDLLQDMLFKNFGIKSISLTGSTNKKKRTEYVQQVRNKEHKVVFATVSLIGEGFDLASLTALFLTTPIKFSGRLIQACGRILRPEKNKVPRIYDFRDNNVNVLKYTGYARDRIYRKEWAK